MMHLFLELKPTTLASLSIPDHQRNCKDITVSHGNEKHDLDARPSDALALAVLMKRPIYVAEDLMERMQRSAPQSQVEFLTGFREIDRDIVLNEHKEQRDNLLQFFASLTRSNLELELQRDKEAREKTKQEMIASWKEERKQDQQET